MARALYVVRERGSAMSICLKASFLSHLKWTMMPAQISLRIQQSTQIQIADAEAWRRETVLSASCVKRMHRQVFTHHGLSRVHVSGKTLQVTVCARKTEAQRLQYAGPS